MAPFLEDWRRRTARSGLEIVMINVWEGVDHASEAADFCDLWGIEAPVLLDETGEYIRQLGIRGVPTNVFIDASGTVTAVGAVTPSELETEIRRLLGPYAPIDEP